MVAKKKGAPVPSRSRRMGEGNKPGQLFPKKPVRRKTSGKKSPKKRTSQRKPTRGKANTLRRK